MAQKVCDVMLNFHKKIELFMVAIMELWHTKTKLWLYYKTSQKKFLYTTCYSSHHIPIEVPLPKAWESYFMMVDHTMIKLVKLIKNLKCFIHGMSYIVTFIVLYNNLLNFTYPFLLSRP